MQTLKKLLADNGLSIAFATLFIVCLFAQSLAGLAFYNDDQHTHGLAPISYAGYLGTGHFLQGIFSNWQAALLQLAALITFGVFLRQRGAPHSRKSDAPKRSRPHDWLRAHSLSLAFCVAFVVAFVLHLLSGQGDYNRQRSLDGQPPLPLADFAVSSKFWFATFQTWEAEFFAIGFYLILSVFLRQQGSPESKPDDASDDETGEGDTK